MKRITTYSVFVLVLFFAQNIAFAGWSGGKSDTEVTDEFQETIEKFKSEDPAMEKFFKNAYGYAVFPTVGKGGIGFGGAYGKGKVFKKGKIIGKTSLTQVSFGLQLGGQAYREIIFFKDKASLEDFTEGNFELGAQASAVAVTAGASADADYDDGVAVFTLPKGGLMYEASVAGQKFNYKPL